MHEDRLLHAVLRLELRLVRAYNRLRRHGPVRLALRAVGPFFHVFAMTAVMNFALAQGAEGIGLFRSELLLAGRPADAVTEEMQYDVYRQLLEDMSPAPVTIRTFDIDEDQLASGEQRRDTLWASGYEVPRSRLGLRSIRLTLKRRELLRTQLRALVRAAAHGHLRVLFPFVSGIDELREALDAGCDCLLVMLNRVCPVMPVVVPVP